MLIPRANRIYSHLTSWLFKHTHREELHYINLESCLVTLSCPTLCDPMDCSLPDSSVYGILQARILEWVAMPPPGDLPNPGIKTQVSHITGRFFTV